MVKYNGTEDDLIVDTFGVTFGVNSVLGWMGGEGKLKTEMKNCKSTGWERKAIKKPIAKLKRFVLP